MTFPLPVEGNQNSPDDQNSGSGSGQENGDQNSLDEDEHANYYLIIIGVIFLNFALFFLVFCNCSNFVVKNNLISSGKKLTVYRKLTVILY